MWMTFVLALITLFWVWCLISVPNPIFLLLIIFCAILTVLCYGVESEQDDTLDYPTT